MILKCWNSANGNDHDKNDSHFHCEQFFFHITLSFSDFFFYLYLVLNENNSFIIIIYNTIKWIRFLFLTFTFSRNVGKITFLKDNNLRITFAEICLFIFIIIIIILRFSLCLLAKIWVCCFWYFSGFVFCFFRMKEKFFFFFIEIVKKFHFENSKRKPKKMREILFSFLCCFPVLLFFHFYSAVNFSSVQWKEFSIRQQTREGKMTISGSF